ncbi:MAG: HlyD family efflux transporter periplasmic adaptor subunit [Candidatus Paceibacterota bacterium]
MIKQNIFKKIFNWSKSHRILSIIIFLVIIFIGYRIYKSVFPTVTIPSYTLSMAKMGSITQTITGSGQVSASNQTDILSQSSGTIKSINVSVGQTVHTGDLIATIDSVNASINLESAKLSYAKLVKPATSADIAISKNNLTKAYDSGWNAVSGVFLNLPNIMSGMKDLLYSQTGFLSDQNSASLSSMGRTYRDTTGRSYDLAVAQYQKVLQEYKDLTRTSATSSIDILIADTYTTIKMVSEATANAQNAINYIITNQSEYQSSSASSALSSVTTWSSQANSDVSNIISAQNSILSSANSFDTLITGADSLDIRSAQLNLEQAQRTYDDYFVRAPYNGIIGRIPVNVYGQASSGTTIATIIGQQKMASISLNEVDAAKIKVGQSVKITFDAIDNFNAVGTVSVVDQIGTVSSGVVSYGVKILINTDDARIKPGMSVNTTIITLQKDNVLTVPSSAIKKQGNESYVQTLEKSLFTSTVAPTNTTGTTTRNYNGLASTTRNFAGTQNTRAVTISTNTTPKKVIVTTGDSDDTNTEILSGLNRGDLVITKTTNGSSAQTTTAPSILSGMTGARRTSGSVSMPTR